MAACELLSALDAVWHSV